jgi:suppressor for copper-sensitivity B
MRLCPTLLFMLACLVMSPDTAKAAASQWSAAENIKARLIAGPDTLGGQASFKAGVQLQLGKGWFTYWRVAGDAGLPPQFDWAKSDNVKSVDINWPVPKRKKVQGLQSFVYGDRVTFPVTITRKNTNKDVALKLDLKAMICKTICIPEDFELTLKVPDEKGSGTTGADARRIRAAERYVPREGNTSSLKIQSAVASKGALVITTQASRGFSHADVFLDIPGLSLTRKPEMLVVDDKANKALFRFKTPDNLDNMQKALNGKDVRIVLKNRNKAVARTISFQ